MPGASRRYQIQLFFPAEPYAVELKIGVVFHAKYQM